MRPCDRSSLPDWARRGHWHLTRWDGGVLEAEKGRVSGWPGYDQDGSAHLTALKDWYNPRTASLVRRAGYDAVWATWSVGFSREHEAPHQEAVQGFIRACRSQGIRVIAYLSLANMMCDELFATVPESVQWAARDAAGRLVPYGAARYTGHATRVMARVDHPDWQDRYILPQVEAAIRAGAVGVVFDNTFAEAGEDAVRALLERVFARMRATNPEARVLMSNYNRPLWHWGRMENVVTTEDGVEPGAPEGLHLPSVALLELPSESNPNDAPAHRPPYGVASNIGLALTVRAVAQWRPAFVEYGGRLAGGRFTRQMAPDRALLAAAECAAFGAGLELYVEPQCAALYRGEPEALDVLDAVGSCHRFMQDHRAWYEEGWQSLARVAVVEAPDFAHASTVDRLAHGRILTDVVLDQDHPDLARYSAVVFAERKYQPEVLRDASAFAESGGSVFEVSPPGATPLVHRARRIAPDEVSTLLAECRAVAEGAQEVALLAPDGVVMAGYSRDRSRTLHLVNYTGGPVRVELRLRVPVRTATLFWPGGPDRGQAVEVGADGAVSLLVPGAYAVAEYSVR